MLGPNRSIGRDGSETRSEPQKSESGQEGPEVAVSYLPEPSLFPNGNHIRTGSGLETKRLDDASGSRRCMDRYVNGRRGRRQTLFDRRGLGLRTPDRPGVDVTGL